MTKSFGMGPIPGMTGGSEPQLTPESAALRLLNTSQAGRIYRLVELTTTVGRDDPPHNTVDIDLTDLEQGETPVISRRHAEFTWSASNLFLTDLGSTNGTMLNGVVLQGEAPRQPSSPTPVKAGDTVVFANLEFETICS